MENDGGEGDWTPCGHKQKGRRAEVALTEVKQASGEWEMIVQLLLLPHGSSAGTAPNKTEACAVCLTGSRPLPT